MTRVEHLIAILAEECDEVGQRCMKALRFGTAEIQPGQPLDNAQRIEHELTDLFAVVGMLEEAGVLSRERRATSSFAAKRAKVESFSNSAANSERYERRLAVAKASDADWNVSAFELVRKCRFFELPHWHAALHAPGQHPVDHCTRQVPGDKVGFLSPRARERARACARVVASEFGTLDELREAVDAMRARKQDRPATVTFESLASALMLAAYKLVNGG